MPIGIEDLLSVQEFFTPLDAEIIGRPASQRSVEGHATDLVKTVMSILRRRPSTIDDLIVSIGAGRDDLQKTLTSMMERGLITVEKLDRGDFYRIV